MISAILAVASFLLAVTAAAIACFLIWTVIRDWSHSRNQEREQERQRQYAEIRRLMRGAA